MATESVPGSRDRNVRGLRIGFFTDSFLPLVGGAETVLHHLASRLARHDRVDRVVVIAPRVRGLDNTLDVPYGVERYRKPFSKRFLVRSVLGRLTWIHCKHRFDVLHCHAAYPPGWVGRSFRRLFGVPLVIRPHGSDVLPGERIRRHPGLEARVRLALAAADRVVAQGAFLREVILSLGVESSRIRTIHNGVERESFASSSSRFDHPRPYVLALANLSHRKGIDVLIEAWARRVGSVAGVGESGSERTGGEGSARADLLIAGDGPERSRLEGLARELGIADRVRFLGAVHGERKVALYRGAELFVCPSRSEPFANVILEALASGLPIVATRVGGNAELVRDGEHGVLVPDEDAPALARAIGELLDSPGRLAALRERVPGFVARFDWSVIAEEYLSLYAELAR